MAFAGQHADSFTRTTVRFDSDGNSLEAFLYLPDGPGPHGCVVMGGGWCYVKELAQPRYAQAFAAAGLAALVFDYRCFGGSEGEPRQHIDPWSQIEDYRNAISYVERRDDIDADRIGVWGISYSGGHVLIVSAIDPRVKAACGVVPMVDGYENMRLAHGTIGLRRFHAALLDARRTRYATGEETYLPHQPIDATELATWPFPQSRKTFAELKASQAPAYEGRSTAQSSELLLGYSVFPFLDRLLGKPTLMMVAEGDDHTHWQLAAKAYDAIPGPAKEFYVIKNAGHLTLYADEETQGSVARDAGAFFVEHLVPATDREG